MGVYKGFSIIELLVYCTLSIFLVILVMQFLGTFERSVIARAGEALYQTCLYAGIDSIARDCSSAPADPRLWLRERPDKIMWQCEQGVLGFAFEQEKLVRISRSLDTAGLLRAPAYSTIVNNVKGSFIIHRSNDLISMIDITLRAHHRDTVLRMTKHAYLHSGAVS